MSESKKYYETGKAIADGFVRGWRANTPGIIDDSSVRIVERRVSEDHRDIGLLLYITRSDWDLLDKCNRVSQLTCDEIFSRGLNMFYERLMEGRACYEICKFGHELSEEERRRGLNDNS